MSFDEISFPLRVSYGTKGGPQFATEIVTVAGGFERRNQKWSQARHRFNARTGVVSKADAAVLSAFFQARRGRARGFRVKDWNDYSSAFDGVSPPSFLDQAIGTGDGTTRIFQLMKTYGLGDSSYAREIKKPVAGSVVIGVNGVAHQTEWSVDITTGLVNFSQAPAAGLSITAGYLFDVPVRFDSDRLNLRAEDANLEDSEIPLIEVRV